MIDRECRFSRKEVKVLPPTRNCSHCNTAGLVAARLIGARSVALAPPWSEKQPHQRERLDETSRRKVAR